MDRNLDSLSGAPGFSYRRLWVTLLVAAAIIAGATLLVRSFPNSGHQAGYEAVTTEGHKRIQEEVNAADGTALPVCDRLHTEAESSPNRPRYDYQSFLTGCSEAIDQMSGTHVPLLAPNVSRVPSPE